MSVLVAATTSAIVLAFLIPLALLLRNLAEHNAITLASLKAQSLASQAATDQADIAKLQPFVGNTLYGSMTLILPNGQQYGAPMPKQDPYLAKAQQGQPQTVQVGSDAVIYVLAAGRRADNQSGTVVVRAVIPERLLHQGVTRATMILAALGMLLLLAAVLAADRLARRFTAPIRAVAAAADAMQRGQLDTRVPERGPPEVVALGRALNRLVTRVEQLLAAERDSVADLSHRLRTPVTALRLDTEGIRDPELAERLRDHVSALERTVDAIVHDARRPSRSQAVASCEVGRVVRERVAFWSALADDQGRALRLAVPQRQLRARLSAADLADVVDALLDNVFAHTEDGVPVEVWVAPRADDAIVLTVEDGGPGLPAGDIVSRGRSGAGSTGLGMDIVRRAALASGGSMELGRSRLGGALVRVVLGPDYR